MQSEYKEDRPNLISTIVIFMNFFYKLKSLKIFQKSRKNTFKNPLKYLVWTISKIVLLLFFFQFYMGICVLVKEKLILKFVLLSFIKLKYAWYLYDYYELILFLKMVISMTSFSWEHLQKKFCVVFSSIFNEKHCTYSIYKDLNLI